MVVVPAGAAQVEGRPRRARERLEGVFDELARQGPDLLGPERQVDHGVGATPDIEDRGREGFVHGHACRAEAVDAGPIAQRRRDRGTEDERHILDRVVVVDVEVAGRLDLEIDEGVMSQRGQEVVVEPDAGRDRCLARPVEPDADLDICLPRSPAEGGNASAALGCLERLERTEGRGHRDGSSSGPSG